MDLSEAISPTRIKLPGDPDGCSRPSRIISGTATGAGGHVSLWLKQKAKLIDSDREDAVCCKGALALRF
jgi:hypothetical protein